MNKIKLELPKEFSFHTFIPVRITDVNYGGHVGNDTFLSLLHEARMQFLGHHHLSEMDFAGASLIMRDVAIEFRKEVFYGEVLKAYVGLDQFSRIGFDMVYKLVTGQEESVVALAKTGMVCYNYDLKKIVSVPEQILKQFQ